MPQQRGNAYLPEMIRTTYPAMNNRHDRFSSYATAPTLQLFVLAKKVSARNPPAGPVMRVVRVRRNYVSARRFQAVFLLREQRDCRRRLRRQFLRVSRLS